MGKTNEELLESIGMKPVKYDPRFPNTNQTKNCYQNFVDYQRCVKNGGKNCEEFKRIYSCLCPTQWVEKWNEEIAEGVFPGRI